MSPTDDGSAPAAPRPRCLAVFGAGYVGLVAAAGFAELGHRVAVCDIDARRISRLLDGAAPFHEPGLDELLIRNSGHMSFSTKAGDVLPGAEVVYICVDTPSSRTGDADLSRLWAVVKSLEDLGSPERREGPEGRTSLRAVVVKSTVPVGTGRRVRRTLGTMGLGHVGVASNPEFTAQGHAVDDFLHPDRVVVGSDEEATARLVADLHRTGAGVDGPVVVTDTLSAEMTKLAANALLATKISFINEIATLCEHTGADVVDVARAVGLDHRLGQAFLRAGIGWGGSCLPKDSEALRKLAHDTGHHPQLLAAVIEINDLQKRRAVQTLTDELGGLAGAQVALLGLAFKAGTDDVRGAPSAVLAGRLLAEGARVRCWDPLARVPPTEPWSGMTRCQSPGEALRGADAAVVVTDWPELAGLDWAEAKALMRRPVVFDGRNLLDPGLMRSLGFRYFGVGRPSKI